MTVFSDKVDKIEIVNKPLDSELYSEGEQIKISGIYECNKCHFNIAMNKHQPTLPPHNCDYNDYNYVAFALIKN